MELSVTQFKAHCLGVIEQVQKRKIRVTLTRYGRPAVELVPVNASAPTVLFGRSKSTTVIHGDIMSTGQFRSAEESGAVRGGNLRRARESAGSSGSGLPCWWLPRW
jgi:prevent-host-death family protein